MWKRVDFNENYFHSEHCKKHQSSLPRVKDGSDILFVFSTKRYSVQPDLPSLFPNYCKWLEGFEFSFRMYSLNCLAWEGTPKKIKLIEGESLKLVNQRFMVKKQRLDVFYFHSIKIKISVFNYPFLFTFKHEKIFWNRAFYCAFCDTGIWLGILGTPANKPFGGIHFAKFNDWFLQK